VGLADGRALSVGASVEHAPSMLPGLFAAHAADAPKQMRDPVQSSAAQHPSPVRHLYLHLPPPSMHVSVPPMTPSLQSAGLGTIEGDDDGERLGEPDGATVGATEGDADGDPEGEVVGLSVGAAQLKGCMDGVAVGLAFGEVTVAIAASSVPGSARA
jgi:hypothetical protein